MRENISSLRSLTHSISNIQTHQLLHQNTIYGATTHLTTSCILTRVVWGLIWVGFVPNPQLTQLDWVGILQTHSRPIVVLGSSVQVSISW